MHGDYSRDGEAWRRARLEGKIGLALGACWAAGAVQEELAIGSEAWVTAAESQSQARGSSQLLTSSPS